MKVKNLLHLTKARLIIEVESERYPVYRDQELDEELKNSVINEIIALKKDEILVKAEKSKAISLEDAGYSFEIGMGTE